MLRSLFTAATGMEAQQLRMDVISNNLANASTIAFKKNRPEFEDMLAETIRGATTATPNGGSNPAPMEVGLGVRTGATTRSLGQGDVNITNNPLDLAIEGSGYFRVQRPNGVLAYTRAGNFRVDATGRIVTQHGELLEPGITIPPDTISLAIKADGTVQATVAGRQQPTDLGQIEVYTFTNAAGLSGLGYNLFAQNAVSGDAVRARPGEQGAGTIAQGQLEASNVKAVEEMIDMIACQRAYEMNSKVIQTADQMLQRLTSIR
jgi:flagellar basal-body rod protein FlgG